MGAHGRQAALVCRPAFGGAAGCRRPARPLRPRKARAHDSPAPVGRDRGLLRQLGAAPARRHWSAPRPARAAVGRRAGDRRGPRGEPGLDRPPRLGVRHDRRDGLRPGHPAAEHLARSRAIDRQAARRGGDAARLRARHRRRAPLRLRRHGRPAPQRVGPVPRGPAGPVLAGRGLGGRLPGARGPGRLFFAPAVQPPHGAHLDHLPAAGAGVLPRDLPAGVPAQGGPHPREPGGPGRRGRGVGSGAGVVVGELVQPARRSLQPRLPGAGFRRRAGRRGRHAHRVAGAPRRGLWRHGPQDRHAHGLETGL